MALPVTTSPNTEWISQFGQTEDEDVELISVFGYLINAGSEPYITDHTDRAASLLIEQLRKPYRVYEY